MAQYLKIIRWPNLVIIALSMCLILLFVIGPVLNITVFESGMSMPEFFLLIVSTLLIAIGGYIVNDIYDINTDSLNKPGRNIVGKTISVEFAYKLYWVSTLTGVLAGTLLSYLVNQINFGLVFLFCAGLLWFYSQKYQCQPLVGNVVVAILSSLSFGLVWLFEFYALSKDAMVFADVQSTFPLINRLILIYMGFAFMVTLLREVVKDMEDYKGDNRFGCLTFTVKFGVSFAKILALAIAYISLLATILIQFYLFIADFILVFSSFFIIDIFFVIIIGQLHLSTSKQNYSSISTLLKILMLIGISTMILFYFEA